MSTTTTTTTTPHHPQPPLSPHPQSAHDLATEIITLLKSTSSTLAIAESLTAGMLMAALVSVPGASAVFRGGVVAYATPLKQSLLNVSAELIAREGVVHPDVAGQMAEGVRKATGIEGKGTTWGVGTTGVAGPGEQDGKAAGTVYIGISSVRGVKRGLGPFLFKGAGRG